MVFHLVTSSLVFTVSFILAVLSRRQLKRERNEPPPEPTFSDLWDGFQRQQRHGDNIGVAFWSALALLSGIEVAVAVAILSGHH